MPTSTPAARFRQRKISVKQTLAVVKQTDIPDLEDEQQRELQQIETGVEKAEESEHHLKEVMNAHAAATSGAKVAQVYIPTPDASKKWSEFAKFYKGKFTPPAVYIRTSATVEDTEGCPYSMDEEDDAFLQKMNEEAIAESKKASSTGSDSKASSPNICTPDEFEMICHKFESVVSEKQPFLSTAPNSLLSLEELSETIIEQITQAENDPSSPEFLLRNMSASALASPGAGMYTPLYRKGPRPLVKSFQLFSAKIYPHYRERKIARGGKSVFPTLKFEDNSEKDDSDPYVCFRRREVRQVRKTRRTDMQSSERLRRLQAEMEAARELVELVVKREQLRKEALMSELNIFEHRVKVKTLKRTLGIKGDDEDLVAHKKKKVEEKKVGKDGKPLRKSTGTGLGGEKGSSAAAVAAANASTGSGAGTTGSSKAGSGTGSSSAPATVIIGPDGVITSTAPNGVNQVVPPNVRLPASKIPDMDLLSIEQVLREKEMAIRNAVKSKLKTRAQQDREWVNYTDNPFVPYCDYFDPGLERQMSEHGRIMDAKHSAYSSIASSYPPSTDMLLKLPLAASLGSSYSSRVEVSPVVMRTALNPETGDLELIAKAGEKDMNASGSFQVPRFSSTSLRKRIGRGGRIMVDRRGLVARPVSLNDDVLDKNTDDVEGQRLVDRYKYDSENHADNMEFACSDPCRLNGISDATQSIRFGGMLLSKAYETYREAYQQRQQQLLNLQQKLIQQQQLQLQQQQQQRQQQIQQRQQQRLQQQQAQQAQQQAQQQQQQQQGANLTPEQIQLRQRQLQQMQQQMQQQQLNGGGAVTGASANGASQATGQPQSQAQFQASQAQLAAAAAAAGRTTPLIRPPPSATMGVNGVPKLPPTTQAGGQQLTPQQQQQANIALLKQQQAAKLAAQQRTQAQIQAQAQAQQAKSAPTPPPRSPSTNSPSSSTASATPTPNRVVPVRKVEANV
ncbi:Epl1p [Sugiyamaella lignohabitans]|uniref:Enhancer of polycomb-like protein n=1 Tax=Sugiyamaella lignohabitans TaxID=796027 RepID=A0A161HI08_9ASCO|nr:Epl1p [Sugiyamaella lignohabitans]ANB11967.1 Epl1p [Sugiyamaella lignohabitans]